VSWLFVGLNNTIRQATGISKKKKIIFFEKNWEFKKDLLSLHSVNARITVQN